MRQNLRKPVLGRKGDGSFRLLSGRLPSPAIVLEIRTPPEGKPQAQGMRELLSEGKGLPTLRECPIRIAQQPQSPRRIASAAYSHVLSIAGNMDPVLLRLIQGKP